MSANNRRLKEQGRCCSLPQIILYLNYWCFVVCMTLFVLCWYSRNRSDHHPCGIEIKSIHERYFQQRSFRHWWWVSGRFYPEKINWHFIISPAPFDHRSSSHFCWWAKWSDRSENGHPSCGHIVVYILTTTTTLKDTSPAAKTAFKMND